MNELRLATGTIWKLLLDEEDKLDPEERELATSMEEEAIVAPLKEKFDYFKKDWIEYFATNEAERVVDQLNEATIIKSKSPVSTVLGLFQTIRESLAELQDCNLVDQYSEILDDFISQIYLGYPPRDPKIIVAMLVESDKIVGISTGRSEVRALENLMKDREFEGTCPQFIEALEANQRTYHFELQLEAGEWKKHEGR